jgi:ribosomal-protein-alanine N-acetyltransferase
MVAGAGDKLWGFLCIALNGSGWAYLRGAAIVNGWRTDDALSAVLEPLQTRLSERGATHLAAYGTALWLVPALQRAGFQRREWIINLERHSRPLALDEIPDVRLRPVAAYDVDQLGALDKAAFAAPFQLEEGELIELLITSGQFAVAELAGFNGLAGYVAADVTGDEGHIMRLATHPALHGRGIGRTLLNGALAYCEQSGARTVGINTQDSNQASLRLYEGFGFRRVGRRVPLLVRELGE